MVLDRGFQDWEQAWHAHDQLLHSHLMLKPLILDPSSATYEKQFEHHKISFVSMEVHVITCSLDRTVQRLQNLLMICNTTNQVLKTPCLATSYTLKLVPLPFLKILA